MLREEAEEQIKLFFVGESYRLLNPVYGLIRIDLKGMLTSQRLNKMLSMFSVTDDIRLISIKPHNDQRISILFCYEYKKYDKI